MEPGQGKIKLWQKRRESEGELRPPKNCKSNLEKEISLERWGYETESSRTGGGEGAIKQAQE